MSNLTDALIAAKLVGGSGGSGGGSGLPEIESTATTVFAEQTLAFSERGNVYGADPLNLVLAIRETYTVTWDGTDYTCTAVDDGSGGVAIGNLSIWENGPDTGEPFMFGYSSLSNATYIFSSSTAASHTIKITQDSQTPADGTALSVQNGAWAASGAVLPEIVENNVEIVPSQTFSFSGKGVFVSPIPGVTFVVGETYTITWDGITYTCTAIDDNGAALGNMAVAELGDDTGEPFAIIYGGSDYIWLTNDSAATHVCAIAQSDGYLPANGSIMQVVDGKWQAVSGGGGITLVKFTVDENTGTITADTPFVEARTAALAGIPVLAWFGGVTTIASFSGTSMTAFYFVMGNGTLLGQALTLADDETVSLAAFSIAVTPVN